MKKEYRIKIILEKSKDALGFKTNETSEPTPAMSLICRELVAAGKLFQARLTQTNSRYFSSKAAADLFLKNSPEKYATKLQAPKKSVLSQPKIWNIPAPVKTGTKPEKAPKKPVEIINNVAVKVHPCIAYQPLIPSRDCSVQPSTRASVVYAPKGGV